MSHVIAAQKVLTDIFGVPVSQPVSQPVIPQRLEF
jgi:hypothetical protein